MPRDFDAVFSSLRRLLEPLTGELKVGVDTPTEYTLLGKPSKKYPEGQYFAGVRRGKAYVSFHNMAVYGSPALLERLSPELRKRMQGKSCFNFGRVEQIPEAELERLLAASLAEYRRQGLA